MNRDRIIQSPFAHCVNGSWYLSRDAVPAVDTIKAYRDQVRDAYGNLRGVGFAAQGIDYTHFVLDAGVLRPVETGRGIGERLASWALAHRPVGYLYPVQDSPRQVRLVREDGHASIRFRLYDAEGSQGQFTRLGAYVNSDADSKHTIDLPLAEDFPLEKAVCLAIENCLDKISRVETRAACQMGGRIEADKPNSFPLRRHPAGLAAAVSTLSRAHGPAEPSWLTPFTRRQAREESS